MTKQDVLTKTLAIAGTLLAWFPLAAPLLLTVIFFMAERMLRFDFLMPAELFPLALAGGVLLLWAAWRSRLRQRLIAWSLGVAAAGLAGSQGLAVLTGLASGQNEPAGWRLVLVLALLGLYILALVAMAVGGALLVRDLFKT
jgi:hypothetical protein